VVGPSLGTRVERLWGPVADDLAEHAGVHVVGWDLPGHGRSPSAPQGFSLDQLAEGVLSAISASLGGGGSDEPWLVAGDSVGGAVALLLLLGHPDSFRAGAVLCSSARFGTPDAWVERAALVRAEGMAPMAASGSGPGFNSWRRAITWASRSGR
jgi:alpha-beta hydrolase superfamily lysophospholipase